MRISTFLCHSLMNHCSYHIELALLILQLHIGIEGNEEADRLAAFASALGQISLQTSLVTEGGIRQLSKAQRSRAKTASGYGVRRPEWNRHAMSAYTWLRTDRGPERQWLHKIGKEGQQHANAVTKHKSGRHIVFDCPEYSEQMKALGNIENWEDLDRPIWIAEEEEDEWDAVEAFFGFLYRRLAGIRGF